MDQNVTALGLIVQLLLVIWFLGLGISFLIKEQIQYWKWTKKTISELVTKQWKLLLGIFIGWILSVCTGTINASFI